jgi:hypothetical protein
MLRGSRRCSRVIERLAGVYGAKVAREASGKEEREKPTGFKRSKPACTRSELEVALHVYAQRLLPSAQPFFEAT